MFYISVHPPTLRPAIQNCWLFSKYAYTFHASDNAKLHNQRAGLSCHWKSQIEISSRRMDMWSWNSQGRLRIGIRCLGDAAYRWFQKHGNEWTHLGRECWLRRVFTNSTHESNQTYSFKWQQVIQVALSRKQCLEEIDKWVTGSHGNRVLEVISIMVIVEALTR